MSQLWVIRSKGAVRLIVMAFLLVLAWSLSRFLAVPPLAEKVLLLAAVAIGGPPSPLTLFQPFGTGILQLTRWW
ncbi:hypothetical protein M1N93_00750 [Dehalococcoidia bacterium]|nr:hypothetical protein [Dehalococcoidia bacterium]